MPAPADHAGLPTLRSVVASRYVLTVLVFCQSCQRQCEADMAEAAWRYSSISRKGYNPSARAGLLSRLSRFP
jgi:hypothetical protein